MMMKVSLKKILGAFSFLVGIILLISSQSGITGNVVGERADAVSSILSLVLIIGGIVLIAYSSRDFGDFYKDYKKDENWFRGRESLREHNKEARLAAKKEYFNINNKNPDKKELKEFMRGYHEKGLLPHIIRQWRLRDKNF